MARRKKTEQYVARNRSSSDIVNFVAFIAGMVTTLLVGLSIWNFISAPDPLKETLAAIDESDEDGTVALSKISINDFDQVVTGGTAEELEELLVHLNNWDRQAELSIRVDENLKRARVANQMLTLPLSPTQRKLAIESQIEALSAVYGFNLLNDLQIPDIGTRLKIAAKLHVDNPNLTIARAARLAVVKVEIYDLVKSNAGMYSAPKLISDKLLKIVKDFPNDQVVLRDVNLVLFSLVGIDRELSLKTMRELLKNPDKFELNREKRFYRNVQDEVISVENDFKLLYNNRWANGKTGQEELLKTALRLAGDPNGNEKIIAGVDLAANWFEQINDLDSARQIYQALVDSESSRKLSELNRQASDLGKKGLSRCNLVGKKLELTGSLSDGTDLDPATFDQDIVVVIFWSAQSDESAKILADFQYFAKEIKFKKVSILAYCVSPESQQQQEKLALHFSGYRFVSDLKGNFSGNSLLDQCPVSQVPQALIVDRQGIVVDANVPFGELKSAIENLLLN